MDVKLASQNRDYALDYKYKQELKKDDWDSPQKKQSLGKEKEDETYYEEIIDKDYYDEKYNKN